MDFSKFSDPNFDAKEWVNGALRTHKEAQTSVDAHASTLVMKLQLFIQEVNGALEESSMQVVQNLPRVLRDVEAVRQEASLLKDQMQTVREDIKKVESETAHSMQRLVELDAMKTRMALSQSALQEADNWTTLSADVDEVFASQDTQKIAEKLAGMQQSLNVLHDVPDFEERKKLLESLKNRLEALLSPKVIAAFSSHAMSEAQQYVKIFSDIERYPQLRAYYTGCHKTEILRLWSSLQTTQPLLARLSTFYNELLSKWHSELTWCSQVFPDPLFILSALFSQSLDSLDPPLSKSLQAALQGSSAPLSILMDLRQAAVRFVKGLERAMATEQGVGDVYELVESVHTPYGQQLVQYPSMEGRLLREVLGKMELSSTSVEDSVALVSASVPRIFNHATEAVDRCVQLTEGWGTCGLLRILESLLSQYLTKLSGELRTLRRGCGLEQEDEGDGSERGEELSHLQSAFSLIQSCGDMVLRVADLNSKLCSTVVALSPALRSPASSENPFGSFDYLTTYHPEQRTAVMELIIAVEKGGGEWPLLVSTTNQIHLLNEQAHTFAFDLLFARLASKLSEVPHLEVWETGSPASLESPRAITDDLPSFSLSPLPYITEIGDYLLTLPQQLEPFTSQDSPALTAALGDGRLPYPDTEVSEPVEGEEGEGEEHPSDAWLGAIARGTMDTYLRNILLIPNLPQQSALQLATDIAYLCNVLAALGQSPSRPLQQLETLCRADKEKFAKLKEDETISWKLYQKMAKLRTWQELA